MDIDELINKVLDDLKDLGDERAIKHWVGLGLDDSNYLGVGLTAAKKYAPKLKRKIKDAGLKKHEVALKLWDTGIYDARVVATHIENPRKTTEEQINSWMKDIEFFELGDKIATNILLKTDFIKSYIEAWKNHKNDIYRRTAWWLLGQYAYKNKKCDPEYLESFLPEIQEKIHDEENRVKEAMLIAIMYIGGRTPELNKKCLDLAEDVEDVEIDYGDTNCQQPLIVKHMTKEHTQKRMKTYYKS